MCQDHISAALALLIHSREIKNEHLKEMLADKSTHHWREGMPHPKKDLILVRFATYGEKKKLKKKPQSKNIDQYYDQTMDSTSKNPWGDLCKSWGVYDHQEVFHRKLPKNDYEYDIDDKVNEPPKPIHIRNKKLAMRLGKRRQDSTEQSDDSASDSEWKSKSKTPRMRMHADDEESKLKKKQVSPPTRTEQDEYEKFAPLSIEVANEKTTYVKKEVTKLSDKFKFHGGNKPTSIKQTSIRSRLGEKIVLSDENSSHSDEVGDVSEDSDHNMMSKVQKVNSKSTGSVWSRLASNQNQTKTQSDLRQILKLKPKQTKPQGNDLRGRLGNSKPANLRIEIDNSRYSDEYD